MKIEDPLPDFLTTSCTPSKEFGNDCASMITTNRITIYNNTTKTSSPNNDSLIALV